MQSAEAKGHQPAWLISLSDLNGVPSKASQIRSDQISRSVVSDSLRPRESQHARPPCLKVSQAYYKHSDPRILGREWEPQRIRGHQGPPRLGQLYQHTASAAEPLNQDGAPTERCPPVMRTVQTTGHLLGEVLTD